MACIGGRTIFISTIIAPCLYSAALLAQPDSVESYSYPGERNIVIQNLFGGTSGSVVLHWTAPGDDGNVGRAAGYDLRVRPAIFGPIDTEQEWNSSMQLANEPTPSGAGQSDSMVVNGLLPGARYYFSIKAHDEVNNYSPLSNSPLIIIEQTPNWSVIGDVNNSGELNAVDLVYLVNSLRGNWDISEPLERADVDGIPGVDSLDIAYLRAYFLGGPAPVTSNLQGEKRSPKPNIRPGIE